MKGEPVIEDLEFVIADNLVSRLQPLRLTDQSVSVSSEPRPGTLQVHADDSLAVRLAEGGLINDTGHELPVYGRTDLTVPVGGSLAITLPPSEDKGTFFVMGTFRVRVQIGENPITGRPIYAKIDVPKVIQSQTLEASGDGDAVPPPRGTIGDDGRW